MNGLNNWPQLQKITWHDTPLVSFKVDVSLRCFALVLDCYEEDLADYVRVKVSFKQIDTLEIELPALSKGSQGNDLEVYSLTIGQAAELHKAELLLLSDQGPSGTISFRFGDVVIT
jgi:hypothetical protein